MKHFGKLIKKMNKKEKISMITAYNYPIASIINEIDNIDAILVGDSLANVDYGYDTTLKLTYDQIIDRVKIVSKAATNKPVVADMTFLSYGVNESESIRNAGNLIKKGGANGIKLEGGEEFAELIYKLTRIGIPVQGHIGLKPQHYYFDSGYKFVGKNEKQINQLIADAKALEEAGAFSLILECVTTKAVNAIKENTNIPLIGIGSGQNTHGQIVVVNDILGMSDYIPSFIKKYTDLNSIIKNAILDYTEDVIMKKFPEE